MNGCNLFFEKGLISKNLANELHISELNGSIAYKCLESLSQREEQMTRVLPQSVISEELKLIHFLLQILATANISQSDVDQLRRLRIIPTESGKLSSLDQKVYMVFVCFQEVHARLGDQWYPRRKHDMVLAMYNAPFLSPKTEI